MASSLGINPHERGLTGLKTWLWVDDAAEELAWTQTGRPGLTKDCDPLPTPQAAFAITVESWTFDIAAEHESASYTSNGPGTEADPAAAHTFQ